MAILKLIRDEYRNTDAISNLVNYVLNPIKMPSMCYGGLGISLDNPADSMYRIKNIYDKTTGKHAEHFVLAFNQKEQRLLAIPFLMKIAYDICGFFENLQVLFAVHEVKNTFISEDYEDDLIHIHFVVNTVNIQTGNKFRIDYNSITKLKKHVSTVLYENEITETVTFLVG